MAYDKLKWLDRSVQYPGRYKEETDSSGLITHTQEPGEVYEAGTNVSAGNMNNMETGVDASTMAVSMLYAVVGLLDQAVTKWCNNVLEVAKAVNEAIAAAKKAQTSADSAASAAASATNAATAAQNTANAAVTNAAAAQETAHSGVEKADAAQSTANTAATNAATAMNNAASAINNAASAMAEAKKRVLKVNGVSPNAAGNVALTAGKGISVSGVTITNAGVRSVAEGSADGTIRVNTNGEEKDVPVAGWNKKFDASRMQYGVTSIDLEAYTEGGDNLYSREVLFPAQMDTTPLCVLVTPITSAPHMRQAAVLDASETGFSLRVHNSTSAGTLAVYWLAVWA